MCTFVWHVTKRTARSRTSGANGFAVDLVMLQTSHGLEPTVKRAVQLVLAEGAVQRYDADVIEALCDIFSIGPGELFELDAKKPRPRRNG